MAALETSQGLLYKNGHQLHKGMVTQHLYLSSGEHWVGTEGPPEYRVVTGGMPVITANAFSLSDTIVKQALLK